jgi:cytochrome c peroxidase
MKKLIIISGLIMLTFSYTFFSCMQKAVAPEKAIAQTLLAQVETFIATKDKLLAAAKHNPDNEKELQQLFLQLRLSYKRFEWASEYFSPAESRFVNGPPVQEIEVASGQIFEPAGLQVIEALLFPKYDSRNKKELIRQLNLL